MEEEESGRLKYTDKETPKLDRKKQTENEPCATS